jgi:hypothetical protein
LFAAAPYYSAEPQVRERVIYGPARKVEKKPVEAQKPAVKAEPMEEPMTGDETGEKADGDEAGKGKLVPRTPEGKVPADEKPSLEGAKKAT